MREKKIIIWGTSVKKIADEAQLLAIMTIVKQQIEFSPRIEASQLPPMPGQRWLADR